VSGRGQDGSTGDGAMGRLPLSRDRIVSAALDIIDREGLAALNMRRLADDAGVRPMTLYHHFPGKGAILDAVGEAIAADALSRGRIDRGDWRDQVRGLFDGLHELVQAHPRALPLISTAVLRAPSGRHWMEELMRVLLEAGFTTDEASRAYHLLGGFTLGIGYARMLSLEVSPEAITAELVGHWADYPSMLRVGMRLAVWDRPGEYEDGVEALLAPRAAPA
jgi:AcrR family transcriptional regulator